LAANTGFEVNKLTEEELLGREFSVTRERIRQIEAGVLSKMSLTFSQLKKVGAPPFKHTD
jgi:DNA-directed RNA polymerase sigma subunit (sigma70/sigma32)